MQLTLLSASQHYSATQFCLSCLSISLARAYSVWQGLYQQCLEPHLITCHSCALPQLSLLHLFAEPDLQLLLLAVELGLLIPCFPMQSWLLPICQYMDHITYKLMKIPVINTIQLFVVFVYERQ